MSSLQEALSRRKTRLEANEPRPAAKESGRGKKKGAGTRLRARQEAASRKNTHLIGGHFPPEIVRQWHLLVAEEKVNGETGQSLLQEAIRDLFVKKGKKALPR